MASNEGTAPAPAEVAPEAAAPAEGAPAPAAAPAAAAAAGAGEGDAPAAAEGAAAAQGGKKKGKKSKKGKAGGNKANKIERDMKLDAKIEAAAAAGGGGAIKKVVAKYEFTNATPKGEKKDMAAPMLDAYHPNVVEAAWGDWWEAQGFFRGNAEAAAAAGEDDRFVMVIPPPNVTGSLHLGHALTNAIEDTLARWHRMSGRPTMWLPGLDHAGIATQSVVERRLAKDEGKTRHDLGREAFLARVWEWKEQYGGRIFNQLRTLGVSTDWTRERFTMDDQCSVAVKEAFVRLFNSGKIYRAERLVNWSCTLNTAISDVEVDYIDIDTITKRRVPGHESTYEFGVLHEFSYKMEDSEEEVVVATTRLETMLGDVAVAVHPEDARYQHLVGKFAVHPFVEGRRIAIITDAELVDMEFGTGCVKITPAHDPNDFACGQRHDLEMIQVFTDDGCINEVGGERFAGLKRFDARWQIEKALKALGQLKGKRPNKMRLGLCSRSGDVVEPMLKPQWWVDCNDMARRALEAVETGDLKLVPDFHETRWREFLGNIRPWCISRQLWWGHRIPAYRVLVNGEPLAGDDEMTGWVCGRSDEEALEAARARVAEQAAGTNPATVTAVQDEDVLDTWFSSGLFPFSTFGWPNTDHPDFKAFYPNSVLETGHDILFFWVARMVMMGLELTDQLPFKTVYLHAMVRDKYGRKMSKSLGNVIDPLMVIGGATLDELLADVRAGNMGEKEAKRAEKTKRLDFPEGLPECGADALRLGLCAYTQQGRNINLDINRVVAYRQFCNKLWNATRFALTHFEAAEHKHDLSPCAAVRYLCNDAPLAPRDEWILHRLNETVKAANKAFAEYQFSDAALAIHDFWLNEFCNTYLELTKPVLYGEAGEEPERLRATRWTLYTCMETGLRLLHPIMPFVTEELWQRLPGRGGEWDDGVADPASVMVAPYPRPVAAWERPAADERMAVVMAAISSCRNIRSEAKVKPSAKADIFVVATDEQSRAVIGNQAGDVCALASGTGLQFIGDIAEAPEGCSANVVDDKVTVLVQLKGLVDVSAELKRIAGKEKKIAKDVALLTKRNASPKLPDHVREKNAALITAKEEELAKLAAARAVYEKLR